MPLLNFSRTSFSRSQSDSNLSSLSANDVKNPEIRKQAKASKYDITRITNIVCFCFNGSNAALKKSSLKNKGANNKC